MRKKFNRYLAYFMVFAMMFSANTTALAGAMASPDQGIILEAGKDLVGFSGDIPFTEPEDAGDPAGELGDNPAAEEEPDLNDGEEGTPEPGPAEETGEPTTEEDPDVGEPPAEDEGPASNVQEPDVNEPANNTGKDGSEEGFSARDPLAMNSLDDGGITPLAVLPTNKRVNKLFPDSVLNKWVRDKFNLGSSALDTVTQNQLDSVTKVDLNWKSGNKLFNLEGIQYFRNATVMELENNSISDLSPFIGLTEGNLKELHLKYNPLAEKNAQNEDNLNSLRNLTGLTVLWVEQSSAYSGNLTSISGLSNLTKLERLSIENHKITSLDGVQNMTKLWKLQALNNYIDSIEPVRGLNLQEFFFERSSAGPDGVGKVSDLSPLEGMTTLRMVSFMNNGDVSDIGVLAGLPNLTHVFAHNNKITSVEAFRELANLEGVWLEGNHIYDLSPFENHNHGVYAENQTVDFGTISGSSPISFANPVTSSTNTKVAPSVNDNLIVYHF